MSLCGCQTQPIAEISPQQMEKLKSELEVSLMAGIEEGLKANPPRVIQAVAPAPEPQKTLKKKVFKKIVIGRVEWISTTSPQIDIRARIDTGAQSCSLHAENILEKTVDGDLYVEFTTEDELGKNHTFLKRVVKITTVKGTSGIAEKRYVVEMRMRFGERELSVNVNLNDRKTLRHKFLVGRNLLLGDYIVDVSQSRLLGDKK